MDQVGRQGRVIGGRYAVTGELGRGGMGVVWRAWDQVIGRDVAIKELHLPDGVPEHDRSVYEERVLREARTAGRLNDPAVVTVHDVLSESGTTYIVMELLQALPLSALVSRQGPLSPVYATSIARQVVSALETAHASGIVHRDVKPSNIMVADGRVKLADFGIAQTLDDPRLTTTGAIVGSPSFMAPERLRGGDATAASDLWSLGATLFFALEGWMPFERQTTAATLHAVLNETPQLSRPHGVIGSVVAGLLIGDPQARLSALQVRALLDSEGPVGEPGAVDSAATHQRTAPVLAPGASAQAAGGRRRRGVLAGLAALGAVLLLVGGILIGRFALAPEPPAAMTPALTYGKDGDIADLVVGPDGCVNGAVRSGEPLRASEDLRCDDPHDVEFFADARLFGSGGDGVDYPGTRALESYGEGFCSAFFASNKIVSAGKETVLRYAAVVPTRAAWSLRTRVSNDENSDNDALGSKLIHCALWRADGARLRTSALSGP